MDEKPTAILQAEEVHDVVPPVVAAPPTSDTWTKFPPQINEIADNKESNGSKGLMIFVIVLILLAVGVVGFVFYKSSSMSNVPLAVNPSPTPEETMEVVPTVATTPKIADKSVVKIQVLNGSGIVGQAGQIATALEKVDFSTPDTGNFDGDKQNDTTVNYKENVDSTLVDEVVTVLKKTFTSVTASVSAALTDFDIQVVTGTGK